MWGQQLTNTHDVDGDGVADSTQTWTYDYYGFPLRYEHDVDGDGTPDVVQDSSWECVD